MVFHAPLHLNSLQLRWGLLDLWSGEIERQVDKPKWIHRHIARLHRPTLGPRKTERSIFRTLRGWQARIQAGVDFGSCTSPGRDAADLSHSVWSYTERSPDLHCGRAGAGRSCVPGVLPSGSARNQG
jgi:hypothetical protein